MLFRRLACSAAVVAALGFAGCSSGSSSGAAPVGHTIALSNGGSAIVLTSIGASMEITATEPGYAGEFHAASLNVAVATVAPASASIARAAAASVRAQSEGSASFTVTAIAFGSTEIIISDGQGTTTTVSVHVSATAASPIVASPASLTFTAAGQTHALAVSEPGYSGTFTASSAGAGVATVSPSSGKAFTVTAAGAGATAIVLKDTLGNALSVPVGVTISTGVISIVR